MISQEQCFVFMVESPEEKEEPKTRRTSEEIRALWKKSILQTMLLIRMEKEKQDLKGIFSIHIIYHVNSINMIRFFGVHELMS